MKCAPHITFIRQNSLADLAMVTFVLPSAGLAIFWRQPRAQKRRKTAEW